jgi:hypothetical protein
MTKYDRFLHEQRIMGCWQITDDLQVLAEGVLEGNLTPDGVANVLLGLQQLYSLKFNSLWDSFESSIR